jgi:hypothetical protein
MTDCDELPPSKDLRLVAYIDAIGSVPAAVLPESLLCMASLDGCTRHHAGRDGSAIHKEGRSAHIHLTYLTVVIW